MDNTEKIFYKELDDAKSVEDEFYNILEGYKKWFNPDLEIKKSEDGQRIHWDYIIYGADNSVTLELKSHPEDTIKLFYDEPFEVTNINGLGWIFSVKADYLSRAIKNKNNEIVNYRVYLWKDSLQQEVFEVLKELLGDNWRYKIEMRGLPNFIETKDKKWKLLRDNKEGKWLLFRSKAYTKDLQITAREILKHEASLEELFLDNFIFVA